MSYQRTFSLERGDARGTFRGILATSGEASDGHILSIDGLEIEEGLPLQWSHGVEWLGSWSDFQKVEPSRVGSAQALVRGTARIELDGKGTSQEFREDLATMLQNHQGAFSLRWDADEGDVRPRGDLPRDHPAFIDPKKTSPGDRRRWGLFFEKSRAIEGSVVSTPADSAALIGRMQAARSEEVRGFYRDALLELVIDKVLTASDLPMIEPEDETSRPAEPESRENLRAMPQVDLLKGFEERLEQIQNKAIAEALRIATEALGR